MATEAYNKLKEASLQFLGVNFTSIFDDIYNRGIVDGLKIFRDLVVENPGDGYTVTDILSAIDMITNSIEPPKEETKEDIENKEEDKIEESIEENKTEE